MVQNLPPKQETEETQAWPRRIPWRRAGSPLQCSCLKDPTERGAWQATVHGVAQSRTRLKQLSTRTHTKETKIPHAAWQGQKKNLP